MNVPAAVASRGDSGARGRVEARSYGLPAYLINIKLSLDYHTNILDLMKTSSG